MTSDSPSSQGILQRDKKLNKRIARKLPLHLFPKVLFQAWYRIGASVSASEMNEPIFQGLS